MKFPPLSVVMSVYNGERFLTEAVESILAQSFADFEFLILDDGSSDRTRQILADFAMSDSRVRLILRENRGLVASLNHLIDEAQAPLVARMDADDISHPERFSRQLAFLAANPDYGVIGSWSEDIDERGKDYLMSGPQPPTDHTAFLAAIAQSRLLMCHPAVMFRRDLILEVGGYHAAFRHCEDLDLWLRLASRTKLGSLPEKLIRYRHYPEQVSSRYAVEQQIGAAVALLAWAERNAGRADPTERLTALPRVDGLDALFGRRGAARAVRARVAPGLLYSRAGMSDEGLDLIVRHLREGGERAGMWRAVARLVTYGELRRAAMLAAGLVGSLRPIPAPAMPELLTGRQR